jgi:polyisoprenoid-binding protein YceI
MLRTTLALSAAALLTLGLSLPTTTPATASAPAADAFELDVVHSTVIFKIKHLNVGHSYGRFNDLSGSFLVDKDKPENSSLNVTVNVESVDTANADRDKHLRSQDFFSAKEFPTMSFKSTAFKKTADNTYDVTGDLTFKGQTKPITVSLTHIGTGPGRRGGEVSGVETTFTIKRSEWNINFLPGALGEDVTLTVALEGGRK